LVIEGLTKKRKPTVTPSERKVKTRESSGVLIEAAQFISQVANFNASGQHTFRLDQSCFMFCYFLGNIQARIVSFQILK
jgi:hypothetical protein